MPPAEAIQELGLPVVSGDLPAALTSGIAAGIASGGGGSGSEDGRGVTAAKLVAEKPFILSEGLPPVPSRLVARILRGEFVDMAELLRDNLEAYRRAGSSQSNQSTSGGRSRREIPHLLSWVQCFGVYMAVVTSKFPMRIRELLAYQTLIVREARRCGGRGWLAYDTHFRQQVVGDNSVDWSRLNQSLYVVTFGTQGERDRRRCCNLCLESGHVEEQCALFT